MEICNLFRICNKCNLEKDYRYFTIIKEGTQLYPQCKNCKKKYRDKNKELIKNSIKKSRAKNLEHYKEIDKLWKLKNKDRVKEINKRARETDKGREKTKQRKNKYYQLKKNDPIYYLKVRVRNRLRALLNAKGFRKIDSSLNYLGCEIQEFKIHLESKFTDGMTWDNYGKWHIDHIIPLAKATDEEEVKTLSHYTNLQPLWAEDNIRKGDSCPVL